MKDILKFLDTHYDNALKLVSDLINHVLNISQASEYHSHSYTHLTNLDIFFLFLFLFFHFLLFLFPNTQQKKSKLIK